MMTLKVATTRTTEPTKTTRIVTGFWSLAPSNTESAEDDSERKNGFEFFHKPKSGRFMFLKMFKVSY